MIFRLNDHVYVKELKDAILKLDEYYRKVTGDNSRYIPTLDKEITVEFDDLSAPYIEDSVGRLRKILKRVAEHNNSLREYASRILRGLDNGGDNLCGESVYYPIYNDQFESAEEQEDARSIRKGIGSGYVGGKAVSLYDYSTYTITLYTRNIGKNFEDYLSVFAYEYFHAMHYFLLEEYGCPLPLPLNKYYYTVVMSSLATYFQINFLEAYGYSSKANEVRNSVMKNSPVFYPYSGCKRLLGWDDGICDIVEETMGNDFVQALRLLVDRYDAEIILQKENNPYVEYLDDEWAGDIDFDGIGIDYDEYDFPILYDPDEIGTTRGVWKKALRSAGLWFFITQCECIEYWKGPTLELAKRLYSLGFDSKLSGTITRINSARRIISNGDKAKVLHYALLSEKLRKEHPDAVLLIGYLLNKM